MSALLFLGAIGEHAVSSGVVHQRATSVLFVGYFEIDNLSQRTILLNFRALSRHGKPYQRVKRLGLDGMKDSATDYTDWTDFTGTIDECTNANQER